MDKNLIAIITVLTFFPAQLAFTQDVTEHPIDKKLDKCIEKNMTTTGMSNCTYEAEKEWDVEMNKYYKLLMGILSKEEKKLLRQAQKAWLKFREAEFEIIKTIYPTDATVFSNIRSADAMAIVKDRTLQLKAYYDEITSVDQYLESISGNKRERAERKD